jgi:ribosomal protein L16 Arg81 hydroxylase
MQLLEQLLSPFDCETFLRDYFFKQALFVPGQIGKFDFFFAKEEFRENLDRVSSIRAVFPQFREADIRPFEIPDMVLAGATVCVTGIEVAHPKVQDSLDIIKRQCGFLGSLSVRAYLSPPGSGFDAHYDARGVTTLQLAGEKTWWYSQRPVAYFPASNASDCDGSFPTASELQCVTLRPGDLLSLPPGAVHRARAATVCLALNVAFEYLGARYRDIALQELLFREKTAVTENSPLPLMPPNSTDDVSVAADIDTVLTSLDEILKSMRASRQWVIERVQGLKHGR